MGKTLIFFADRWFQCEYIVEKNLNHKVLERMLFTLKIENSDTLFADSSGRRSNKENEAIMEDF
ncbi:hypothetical protein GCM10020331_073860 [Ectobacillus funiculus]